MNWRAFTASRLVPLPSDKILDSLGVAGRTECLDLPFPFLDREVNLGHHVIVFTFSVAATAAVATGATHFLLQVGRFLHVKKILKMTKTALLHQLR